MEFKAMAREQFLMLLIDQQAAVAAIPQLIPKSVEARRDTISTLRQVLVARGEIVGEVADRLREVAALLGVDDGSHATLGISPLAEIHNKKAS
jgi:hypothetical protein